MLVIVAVAVAVALLVVKPSKVSGICCNIHCSKCKANFAQRHFLIGKKAERKNIGLVLQKDLHFIHKIRLWILHKIRLGIIA